MRSARCAVNCPCDGVGGAVKLDAHEPLSTASRRTLQSKAKKREERPDISHAIGRRQRQWGRMGVLDKAHSVRPRSCTRRA